MDQSFRTNKFCNKMLNYSDNICVVLLQAERDLMSIKWGSVNVSLYMADLMFHSSEHEDLGCWAV
jgi:hypothetical protein